MTLIELIEARRNLLDTRAYVEGRLLKVEQAIETLMEVGDSTKSLASQPVERPSRRISPKGSVAGAVLDGFRAAGVPCRPIDVIRNMPNPRSARTSVHVLWKSGKLRRTSEGLYEINPDTIEIHKEAA